MTVVEMDGYLGGLNKDADVARLEPDETPEALNVQIGPRGEVTKRKGYVRYDTGLTTRIETLFSWTDGTGKDWLMAIDSTGQIFASEGSSGTFTNSGQNIGAGGSHIRHPVGLVVANGNLYVSHRRGGNTLKWTGSTWSSVAAVPKAQFLRWRFEQLFVANVAGKPSDLRVSIELNPEDFTTEPAIFGFEPDDGTEIRGMAASGDDLLVFKDHSIHIFAGKVRSDFQKYRLDSLRGTFSPRSIQQVRGLIIFYDRDTGVWAWDGSAFTLISEKLNRYLLDNVTYESAFLATGFVRRDSYFLSLPWQGGTTNQRTFMYSTLTNSWTEWDFGVYDGQLHLNRDFIAGPRGELGVYEAGVTNQDNGANIHVQFKTPWMTPGGPGNQARLRRLETNMAATGAQINVTLYQEYDGFPVLTRSFEASNPNKMSESDLIKNLNGWGGRADSHQLEFVNDDDNELQINWNNAIFSTTRDILGEHV